MAILYIDHSPATDSVNVQTYLSIVSALFLTGRLLATIQYIMPTSFLYKV